MSSYPPIPLGPRDDNSPATPNSHAQDHTDERNAINAVVAVLGPAPQGTAATVQDRLANVEDAAEGAWSAAAGAAGAAADAHARLDALENADADVHEDVLVLDGDSLASADVVFDKVRRTVIIDIDITDIFGPPKFAFETPVVVETDASFTITPDTLDAITLTVASGTYTHLEDLVWPLNDTQGYVNFSVADGDAEGKRVRVTVADTSVTFDEGDGGLALLNLSALDEQTVPAFSEEFGSDFEGEPDPAEPYAGRVSVAWISGANTEFGPDGPAVKVIPYNPSFSVQAPPTALIDAITAPGSYQMVATGGPAGTVVVSAGIGSPAMDNVVHGTITITGY